METIYWIQRLGALSTTSVCLAILFALMGAVLVIIAIGSYNLGRGFGDDDKDNIRYKNCRKAIPKVIIAFCISLLGCIFIPSEKDLYAIYGIGGTIDYIKSNDTAKQLPDKVVNALDAWLDNNTPDNNKDNE